MAAFDMRTAAWPEIPLPSTAPATAPARAAHPGRATLRRAGAAVASALIPFRDAVDRQVMSAHTPTVGDDSAWCTRHFGGLEEWPCRDYVEAAAALEARRR